MMGSLRNFLFGPVVLAALEPAPKFAIDAESMPAQIFGLESYADAIGISPRISRREAMQCTSFKRARDLICGGLGGLPLVVIDTERITRVNDLLDQPEKGLGRTVTMTRTIEDLLFEGMAYWKITERAFDGYPRWIRRVHPSKVDVNEDTGEVRIDGKIVPGRDVIQFHSPSDGLLVVGGRAIRACMRVEQAVANMADGAPPVDYFTPSEGADPADDADVVTLLDNWKAARRMGSTAYVPAALSYHSAGWSPEQMELGSARQAAVLDISRLTGVDAEWLGVSTTSRTYQNIQDARKAFVDFTLGPLMHSIEDRLSLGDVTKRGFAVAFNLSDFLRSDDKTRMETYEIGLRVGATTQEEIRASENKPAITPLSPQQLPSRVPEEHVNG